MREKYYLSHLACIQAVERMHNDLLINSGASPSFLSVHPIPRGGVPVYYLLRKHADYGNCRFPKDASMFLDDIVDSGATRERYRRQFPDTPFFALTDYLETEDWKGKWVVFPWEEGEEGNDASAHDITTRLLEYIGEDPEREGLIETPARMMEAWKEWTSGYSQNPKEILKTFGDGAQNYDEMVLVKDIPFYSHCEHHLAPFFGTVTVAYIPDKKIVGLSKLSRVVDVFARRLQVQERMTVQITDALVDHLHPKGAAVLVKARHLCMESRGISRQGHETITSVMRGAFFDNYKTRSEFMAIAK